MNAIKERRIVIEFGRKRLKQVRSLKNVLRRVVDIALKHHGPIGIQLILATRKRSRCHVIFENLNSIRIFEAHTRHFIERNAIPIAHQARTH